MSSIKSYMLLQKKKIMHTDVFLLKKRLLTMSLFIRYSLIGVEYSVVLPTALLYLKSLDAGPFFTGLTIAAYPAAAMISLPLFGYLYDRSKRIRELMLLLNMFELVGNILYALPYSKWFPICGRFIAGLGDGFLALAVGEISYIYEPSERLGILSVMELGRIAGVILGPSFNLIIKDQKYFISTWVLNDDTLPGVLMAFLWLLMQLITVFCVFNLAKELTTAESSEEMIKQPLLANEEDNNEADGDEADLEYEEGHQQICELGQQKKQSIDSVINSETSRLDIHQEQNVISASGNSVNQDSESDSSSINTTNSKCEKADGSEISPTTTEKKSYSKLFLEIFCLEFVIIQFVDFVLWFSQTNFEILTPYITEFSFNWSATTTGLVYMVGGIIVGISFGFLYIAGTKFGVKMTSLLVLSLILTQISLGLLIYETIPKSIYTRYGIFAAMLVSCFGSIPLNLVCSKYLLTKLFRPELQGMVQGISAAISRITMITGPILSGYIFKDRRTYGAITSIACFFAIIAFFCGIQRLNKKMKAVEKSIKNYEKSK